MSKKETFKFQENKITGWTILPSKVIAKAWTSETFKKELIKNPAPLLQSISKRWPKDRTTVVLEDRADLKHFVLPNEQNTKGMNDLLETIKSETDNDDSLEWSLPAEVIYKTFTDRNYKLKLVAEPKKVLEAEGYNLPESRILVLENSETTYHGVLPKNPINLEGLDFNSLNNKIKERFMAGKTGQCCASGTCS